MFPKIVSSFQFVLLLQEISLVEGTNACQGYLHTKNKVSMDRAFIAIVGIGLKS